MSQTNLNNVTEEIVNDPAIVPVVDAVEAHTEEVVQETETKRKSFFDIFKKKSTVEEEKDDAPVEAEVGETDTPADADADAPAEVPVEEKPAKKCGLCGLCAFGKKKEEPVAEAEAGDAEAETDEVAETTEEVAPKTAEAEAATEEVTEEPVVAAAETEEPIVAEEPVVAAAVAEEETTAAVLEVPAEEIARVGLLYKSGKFLKSHFNGRHCRLLHAGTFQYSKTDDFTGAHEIKLCKDTSTVAFMAEGEDAEHKYRFELHCCKDVITLATDSEEDRDEWIRAIETVKEKLAVEEVEEAVAEEVAAE